MAMHVKCVVAYFSKVENKAMTRVHINNRPIHLETHMRMQHYNSKLNISNNSLIVVNNILSTPTMQFSAFNLLQDTNILFQY